MKPSKPLLLTLLLAAIAASGGFWWHHRVQEDHGFYHLGYQRGEIARLTAGLAPAPGSDPFRLSDRAKLLFDEGYQDALSQSPPRYPYAEVLLSVEDIIPPESKASSSSP